MVVTEVSVIELVFLEGKELRTTLEQEKVKEKTEQEKQLNK
jgi:hypothetical protein